jgi:hypothetical protein
MLPGGVMLTIGAGDLSWEVPVSTVDSRPPIMRASPPAVPDREVASIVRSLAARTNAPTAVIERVVAEELLRFQGARVPNFIPILVERAAAPRLAGVPTEGADRLV